MVNTNFDFKKEFYVIQKSNRISHLHIVRAICLSIMAWALMLTSLSLQAQDCDKNWVLTRTYDENGNEIGTTKAFFDNNGKSTQTQTKNETNGQVLANQTIYDLQGRAVIKTLSAPINNSAFAYNYNFLTSQDAGYNYLNFDGDPTNTTNPYAKLNTPDPVDNTQPGSLGWYYSNNNTLEPMVGATSFPYTRTDFYHDGTGSVKRLAGIGEQLKMGTGHEITNNSFPVQNELNNYLAIRNQFFPAATVGSSPANMVGQGLQSASKDENGFTGLSITDLSGKMNLVTGRADPSVNAWLPVTNTLSLSNVTGQYTFNIHIDGISSVQGNTNDPAVIALMHAQIFYFNVSTAYPITVTCTNGGIATWTGIGNNYAPPQPSLTGSYSFVITSAYPFYISATNTYGAVYDQAEAPYTEPSGASIQYFQLAVPSVVNITGNYTLYNMTTETALAFTSGNTLPAGYYKITATTTTNSTVNNVTVSYTNKYSDLSYTYYNQLGQLIASIAPNGVQQLILNQTNLSQYTLATLPFVTTYQYDLQGRLISTTSPDGGTSQIIYRQDGKIRFSQNTYQKNAINAGLGNAEKFSYTNYDNFGRAFESGEYAVTTATFASLTSNTTILENTTLTGGLSGGTKLSQINTYYDVPAANISLPGYVQDAGFLKGAVSYTSNANSTTWYNYDDHGRVTWMVKQITGLIGYKTVNYTYNDQGNATIVDYQHGTAAERFMHFYKYDADGRLINIQTSRDGITMVQQANYYYYLHGPLKRIELGNQLQGLDYVYTPQGWLKEMNSASGVAANDPGKDGVPNGFSPDAFGMQLEYFPGDYIRTGSNITSIPTGTQNYYNGNVTGMSWQSNKPSAVVSANGSAVQNPDMYTYTYDSKYQYTGSVWGSPNFTSGTFAASSANIFQEKQVSYDFNGNISAMQHTGPTGILIDNFSYNYTAKTNMLTSVANAVGPSNYGSYTYDEIGRLKSQANAGGTTYLKYDVTGKITGIYADAAFANLKIGYIYDESGNRIASINNTGSQSITTYYVYDGTDNVLAIYSQTGASTPTLLEIPIYGSDRLGTYFAVGNYYVYEIRDNVGSVRVTLTGTKINGQASVYNYGDYYPFGGIAQNSTGYRYDYQGAYSEKDALTGYNNFQLRMYDGRIGRWLSTDPDNQFISPYEGMGNDPVSWIDPTGGDSDWHYVGLNLVADLGDNANTLSDFLHTDLSSAQAMFGNISNWDNGALQHQGLGFDVTGHILTMGDPSWLTTSKGEYGVSETGGTGGASNPRILQYFKATSLITKTDQTPWCAAFQNWVLKQNKIKGTNSAAARSFKTWGKKLERPALGALIVLPNNHHVSEIAGITKNGSYVLLGGNQSDAVQYSIYKAQTILMGTIVYPNGYTPSYNLPILNINHTATHKTN